MARLTKEQVWKIVCAESDYADKYDCEISLLPDRIAHDHKPLELWLLWMEQYLSDARKAVTNGYNKQEALNCLRIILSLGMNAAMRHGLPSRKKPRRRGRPVIEEENE